MQSDADWSDDSILRDINIGVFAKVVLLWDFMKDATVCFEEPESCANASSVSTSIIWNFWSSRKGHRSRLHPMCALVLEHSPCMPFRPALLGHPSSPNRVDILSCPPPHLNLGRESMLRAKIACVAPARIALPSTCCRMSISVIPTNFRDPRPRKWHRHWAAEHWSGSCPRHYRTAAATPPYQPA